MVQINNKYKWTWAINNKIKFKYNPHTITHTISFIFIVVDGWLVGWVNEMFVSFENSKILFSFCRYCLMKGKAKEVDTRICMTRAGTFYTLKQKK